MVIPILGMRTLRLVEVRQCLGITQLWMKAALELSLPDPTVHTCKEALPCKLRGSQTESWHVFQEKQASHYSGQTAEA